MSVIPFDNRALQSYQEGAGVQAAVAEYQNSKLIDEHLIALQERGINAEVAASRGVWSATKKSQLKGVGFNQAQQLVPALVIPVYNTLGEVSTYQIRSDIPRMLKGKIVKYETVAGSSTSLDVPPDVRPVLRDHAVPLFITEGPLKADAAVSHDLPCIALIGVWNFGRSSAVLADWDNIVLKNRDVYLVFDSDAMTKPQVHAALGRLKGFVERRGARVFIVYLPQGEDGSKTGLDDYLAAGHSAEDVIALADETLRPLSKTVDITDNTDDIPYVMTDDGIGLRKDTKHGEHIIPLTNFAARIRAEVVRDDGTEILERSYEIEAVVGGQSRTITVPAVQFASMTWINQLGTGAILSAGSSLKDHGRAAIQWLSPDVVERRVYAHTGWTRHGDQWIYISSGGGINAAGFVPQIDVDLQGQLAHFRLPAPPEGEALQRAVRASLDLIPVGPGMVTVPLLAAVYRAPLGVTDFGLHLAGETGAGKSVLSALIQQHFGAGLDLHHLPGSWSSTENALEALLHAAKDALCVVDDFVPTGTQADMARLNRTAERLFRGQGNNSGRMRMNRDLTLRVPQAPRGIILSTGEEWPHGASLAARRVDLELHPADLDWEAVTASQRLADAGVYAQAIAGYIQWLAPRLDDIRATLPSRVDALRDAMAGNYGHRRTPSNIAHLAVGFEIFLTFAVDVGAVTEEEQIALQTQVETTLREVAELQDHQRVDTDPVIRFLDLIPAAVRGSQAYLTNLAGEAPTDADRFGWRGEQLKDDLVLKSMGLCIGAVEGDDVYLNFDVALQVAQRIATQSGDALTIQPRTLKHRLKERGLLASTDDARGRTGVRKTISGGRLSVLHFHVETLFPAESQPAHLSLSSEEWPSPNSASTPLPLAPGGLQTEERPIGQVGTSGTVQATIASPIKPSETRLIQRNELPCMNEGHVLLWLNDRNQYMCSECRPPAWWGRSSVQTGVAATKERSETRISPHPIEPPPSVASPNADRHTQLDFDSINALLATASDDE